MAQKIPASYTVERGKAYAGQIADTSAYNIDGACVAEGSIGVGRAVALKEVEPIGGHKVVVQLKDASLPIFGVAIMSHAYSPEGVYEDAGAINVMTHGRVWALASKSLAAENVKPGSAVNFDADGIVAAAGVVTTGYVHTGQILPAGSDYKIVQIQILQSAKSSATGD